MSKQETNKLIAGFMGLPTEKVWADCVAISEDGRELGGYVESYFNYDYSWDNIMPVVQKILSINQETMETYSLYLEDSLRSADIKNVYKSVVNYIEWRNSQLI